MARHETLKQDIPQFHFRPEGYVSSSDPEYLDQFLVMLKAKGFDPDQLVFSGFDGKDISKGLSPPRHNGIYIMNVLGWRGSLRGSLIRANPAGYAERHAVHGVPCIGLYDKDQLTHIYDHRIPEHPNNTIDNVSDLDPISFMGTKTLAYEPDENGTQHFDNLRYDEYIEEREEFFDIVPGERLADLPVDKPLEMPVMHNDYLNNPDASPTDALVGLVFLEELELSDSNFSF